MTMEIIETEEYYSEDLQLDFADVIAKMLEGYREDDLTELLCECEMLLQTNNIYLKKLKERGFRKLYNLLTGIEDNCKYRLQDNYQLLHKITLLVEKKILLRFDDLTCLVSKLREKQAGDNIYMQYCINSLAQKLQDSQATIKKVDIEVTLLKWLSLELEQEPYISGSDTRKILQIISDIYVITGGCCECEHKAEIIEKALKQLGLSDVEISPVDFAKEIMRDSECLPLYIKEREDHNLDRSDLSGYGGILYQIRDLVVDRNIQELVAAKKETMGSLCLPLLKEAIEEKEVKAENAALICWQLLEDMKKMHTRAVAEQKRMQEIEDQEKKRRDDEERVRQKQQKEKEEKEKKYSLLLATPANMLVCSLEGYIEDSFEPTNNYGISEKNLNYVKEQIDSFSPAIIVKPGDITKTGLAVGNDRVHMASLADFYFCLWHEEQKPNKNIALIDYYEGNLYVSCYKIEAADRISKKGPFSIRASKTRKHIIDAIKVEFFKDIPDQEITLFRIFESQKYIDKKLEKVDAPFIKVSWRDSLKRKEEREKFFQYFYEFEQEVLSV